MHDHHPIHLDSPDHPYEPNAALRWLYDRFFSHIHVDDTWVSTVRDAAARGTVVYVMRSVSFLDFLCLDFLTKRFGLPQVRFVNDLGLGILEPFGQGRRRFLLRGALPEDALLRGVIRERHSAGVFLRRPKAFSGSRRRSEELDIDVARLLVEEQRRSRRPILLMPQTFVWNKLPPNRHRTLWDWVFGPSEWPGALRVSFQFLLNYRHALLRAGEPFELQRFLESTPQLDDSQAADKVRYALLRRLERERSIVLGPSKKTAQRIREEILRSPRVHKQLQSVARTGKRDTETVLQEANRELQKMCAAPHPHMLALLHRALDHVWNRLYDGMKVDEEGMRRIREAARHGTLVLLPSHKSHMDYVVLSDVFYGHDLSPPLVAAGENLSFWPLGPVFRRAGAFFIRRSLSGAKLRLYSGLLEAYIRKIMFEGFSVEVFLEGGRSRTGKLLFPQLGLLAMIVDGAFALRGRRVCFVPIAIGYERIVEEGSYVHELGGGDKPKEDLAGLLKTPTVFRSRYGRLYVQVGEIFSFDDMLRQVTSDPRREGAEKLSPKQRRNLIQNIARRSIHEIQRVTPVTPSALVATALLSHLRRGTTYSELLESCRLLLDALQRCGARVTLPVARPDGSLSIEAVNQALELFVDGKLVARHGGDDPIFRVPEDRRIALEYYKNNILPFLARMSMVAVALLAERGDAVPEATLRARVQELADMFRYEFIERTDISFDARFDDVLHGMLQEGEIERVQSHAVRPALGRGPLARMELYAALIQSYLEAYRLAAHETRALLEQEMATKDWVKRTLVTGRRMYHSGGLELPEALSRPKLENALRALHDAGVVRILSSERVQLGRKVDGADDLQAHEQRILHYVRG